MTLPRIITAVFFVPLTLAAIWYGSLPFFIYIVAVGFLGFWEYSLMAEEGGYPNQMITGLSMTVLLLLALFVDGGPGVGPLHKAPSAVFLLVAGTVVMFLREFLRGDKGHAVLRIQSTLMGVLLCGFLFGHVLLLRDMKVMAGEGVRFVGREITLFLFLVIWALDTGAWVVGKAFGRFPMAPQISPKKTWVGALGGTAAALGVGVLLRDIMLTTILSRREAVFMALLIVVVAQVSDLSESLLKRTFGVKNSSEILPGHGGILDRFDSLIFAAPLFYYMLLVTGRFQ